MQMEFSINKCALNASFYTSYKISQDF